MADMVKWLTQTAVNRSYMGSIPIIRPIDKKGLVLRYQIFFGVTGMSYI